MLGDTAQTRAWDITKLKGPEKWSYYYLYVLIDIYSRYVVGWLLARQESSELAKQLLADSVKREGVEPGSLTIHADNGSSMASQPVAFDRGMHGNRLFVTTHRVLTPLDPQLFGQQRCLA